jgi:hypothetical protein
VRCERESVGVVSSAALPRVVVDLEVCGGQIDRAGCASRLLSGRDRRRREGTLGGQDCDDAQQLELFAQSLARTLKSHVAEVVLAHAKQVRAISHARVKTDKIDAKVLADLLAADLIPRVWIGDERTRMLRRLVSRRRGLVKRRTQIKNEISAVLHRNLKGRSPASDPFGAKGRAWIAEQVLPIDERLTVDGASWISSATNSRRSMRSSRSRCSATKTFAG